MSLSRPQAGASANTTNVAITATAQGDLVLVFAYNKTNNTIPSLPAGFTSIATATTANGAMRIGFKISTSAGDTSSGTWTNATNVACIVFRSSLGLAFPGSFASTTGSGTVLTYLGMTATNSSQRFRTDGNSWVAGFGGARSATAGMNGNTTHLTSETSQTNINGLDSEAGLSSFADETLTVTTTGEWATATVEVLEPNGEIPSNTAQVLAMYAQMKQNVLPGYARRIRIAGGTDWHLNQNEYLFDNKKGVNPTGALASSAITAIASPAAVLAGQTDGPAFGLIGGKRTDVGNPTQPSQMQDSPGRLFMLIPVSAGARQIKIDVRFAPDSGVGNRPRLYVPEDLDMGVQAAVSSEAAAQSGTTFQTITLNVTVAVDGVLAVYREQQDTRADAWTLWDNLLVG